MAANVATDAQRPASDALCPECERTWAEEHASDCVLRPVLRYSDYLRFVRANHPEDYWGGRQEYLTDP